MEMLAEAKSEERDRERFFIMAEKVSFPESYLEVLHVQHVPAALVRKKDCQISRTLIDYSDSTILGLF